MHSVFPDYNNSILNTVASLLTHFGAKTEYPTLPILDASLAQPYQNIVFMVFDGLGTNVLYENLSSDSFLIRHHRHTVTSVYPSTTVSAMTTYYSGLSPNAHGWLGWKLFFKEFGENIDVFPNRYSSSGMPLETEDAARAYMPYPTIYEQIHISSRRPITIHTVNPSDISFPEYPNHNHKADNMQQLFHKTAELCTCPEQTFTMTYWNEPDATLHASGVSSPNVRDLLSAIDRQVAQLCGLLQNTLVIISADHGMIDMTKTVFLNDIPEIDACLLFPPSIEQRAVSFFIRPGMQSLFEIYFQRQFGDDFILFTKQDMFTRALLGSGAPHPKVNDFIGDYFACATGQIMLDYRTRDGRESRSFQAQHAGLTAEEMLVPLILISR